MKRKRKISRKERLKMYGFYKTKSIQNARNLALNAAYANGYKYGLDEKNGWIPFYGSRVKPSEAMKCIEIMAKDSFEAIIDSGICNTDIRTKTLFWDMYHVFKKGRYERRKKEHKNANNDNE